MGHFYLFVWFILILKIERKLFSRFLLRITSFSIQLGEKKCPKLFSMELGFFIDDAGNGMNGQIWNTFSFLAGLKKSPDSEKKSRKQSKI